MKTVVKIFCKIFGHNYKLKRRISKSIAELKCARCKSEFGINTSVQSLLPLDDELRQLHGTYNQE